MAFAVPIEINRSIEVECEFDRVFDLLANVPESAGHFPKLDRLEPLGDDTYRWHMKKIRLGMYAIQTVYACRYSSSREEGWVEWKPVEGEGNATIEGFWNFEIENASVYIEFYIKGELILDIPILARMVVSPLVAAEFNGLINTYIANLQKTFAG